MDYQLTELLVAVVEARSVRTTANVARVEELIRSYGVAPSNVIRFH